MHPRLLEYYNSELVHLREMGMEFSKEFPKVAGRLGMEGMEVTDPYVERLMEGFAFVAARIQLKLDAEFPRFTQHLLEMIYPHYLAPTPSCAIISLQPNFSDSALAAGVTVPRGSTLRSIVPRGQQTPCEFRSAHAVTLFPIELVSAGYFSHAADLPVDQLPGNVPIRSGLRLKLKCHGGLKFSQLQCHGLTFHINAADDIAVPLYELILSQCVAGMVVQAHATGSRLVASLGENCVAERGFDDNESLIPYSNRSFQGYRLLHEYFAFPQRFLFFEICNLYQAFNAAESSEIDLVLLFGRDEPKLEGALEASNLCLYATPVVNLFERRADRVQVHEGEFEHHLVVDRTRPLDYEVFSIQRLRGFGAEGAAELEFCPFYASFDASIGAGHHGYYTVRREPRLPSSRQQQSGGRSSYTGTEVYLSLVDAREAPYPSGIKQLAADVWVTNRDLPLLLPVASQNPLSLDASLPVTRISILRGPTRPRACAPEGEYAWRLVNHLSLNYLTLIDEPQSGKGTAAFKALLELYADVSDPATRKQIDSLLSIASRPVVRRLPIAGPIAFGRGLEIDVHIDEGRLAGSGGFLIASLLEKFFARYVSINSFTETRLISDSRAEVYRWPARVGMKQLG